MRAAPTLLLLALLAAGCTAPQAEVRARAGDFVVLDIVLAAPEDGRELRNDTGVHAVLRDEVPVRLPEGWDPATTEALPLGLAVALEGLQPGQLASGLLGPADAYGQRSEERTIRAPLQDAVPRELHLPAGAAILKSQPPQLTWANHTWTIELLGQDGAETRVWLNETPAPGTLLELPTYWNEHYQLWRSEVTGGNATHLLVEHRPGASRTVDVGGVAHRVGVEGAEAVADGNHPLAGRSLRFRVALREVVFAGSSAFPPAAEAKLVALDGARLNVSDLRGKPVLLDFFASWCVTCKQQAPILARAREAWGDHLAIVSVTIDPTDTPERLRAFQTEAGRASLGVWGRTLPADWTFAFDPTGEAARGFSVTGIPREVVLDADGRLRATSVGLRPWADLRGDLAPLLGEP
ncbi:MAG TPA: redoxin family protein [Candidatus Thermoplasmatota archaeon]|jgi:cytochrome c biogenesis protein CcmG/thiol:disulfide interchange protein DsbE|nr:redoxin family protein [Candidatus Thermoplasmatota archaeon]